MTAPTPGDLSARHMATLEEWRRGDQASTEAFNAAIDYAIAALSALPAAGGLVPDVVQFRARAKRNDGVWGSWGAWSDASPEWVETLRESGRIANGFYELRYLYTTPQPSAAEDSQDEVDALHVEWNHLPLRDAYMVSRFLDKAMALIRRLAAATPPPDAAVGAQGDGQYLPVHVSLIREIERVGTRCLDSGKCHHGCIKTCSRRNGCVPLSIAGSYLNDDWTLKAAAPAAGKGVDGWLDIPAFLRREDASVSPEVHDALMLVNGAANDARHRGEYEKANKLVKARLTLYRAAATEQADGPKVNSAMAAAFIRAHDESAASRIPKIFAKGQRRELDVIVGLRAALEAALTRQPVAGSGK